MNGAVRTTGALFARQAVARIGDESMMPVDAASLARKSVTEAAQFETSRRAPEPGPIDGRRTTTSGAMRSVRVSTGSGVAPRW